MKTKLNLNKYIYTMKNAKQIGFTLLSTLLFFVGITFNACKTDKCKQVNCAYSGVCKEGTCICQIGYEGEHCETITREKFKGLYAVDEDGTISGTFQYALSVESGAKINEVRIKNLQNYFDTVLVSGVTYLDTLTIPLQTLSNGYQVEGYGYIVDTNPLNQHYYQHAKVTFYYKVTDPLGIVNEYGSGGSQPSIWSK